MKTVWHVAGMGNYHEVVLEQLALLATSGIDRVDVFYVGPAPGVEYVRDQGERAGVNIAIVANHRFVRYYEKPAL